MLRRALNDSPLGANAWCILAAKGYDGYWSYEAPNPAAWARDPETVAREALATTWAQLPF